MRSVILRSFGVVLATLLVGEAMLQAGAALIRDRSGEWRPNAKVRVLSVGDSHTFGAGVDLDQSYPAHLQDLLDAREPGRYSVINLGIPGLSTTQVRNRIPLHVSRYRPDLVILWCGVNNAWNYTEVGRTPEGLWHRLDALASRSRLYRLARVWVHDRRIERSASLTRADGKAQLSQVDWKDPDRALWKVHHGGVVEEIRTYKGESQLTDEMEERVYEDYVEMVRWLRSAGIPSILIRYPLQSEPFGRANRAIARAANEEGVPVIDSGAAVFRLPKEEQLWRQARHPNGAMYREIARDIIPVLESLVDGPGGASASAPVPVPAP
jgi:lysophospholipase L1-like esterase